jgi:hypothetical protein
MQAGQLAWGPVAPVLAVPNARIGFCPQPNWATVKLTVVTGSNGSTGTGQHFLKPTVKIER